MKQLLKRALTVISATALLAAGTAGSTQNGDWQSEQLEVEAGGPVPSDVKRIPSEYDLVLLALGQSVYANLQRARQAALDRESTNLIVAIHEARETLHRLLLPAQKRQLQAQLQIIRKDLGGRSMELDKELWVPLNARIDATLVIPEEVVRTEEPAAPAGGQEHSPDQLDVSTPTTQYSLGVFPLGKIKADLESAQTSANLEPPDWTGALEAVQSGLDAFHWFGRVAPGLQSAYNDAVNAYVLAAGPAIRDDQKREILRLLDSAERALDALPEGSMLSEKARILIEKGEPEGSDIKSLLNEIQAQISAEHEHEEVQYWKTVDQETPE